MGECLGICERYDTTGNAGYIKGYKWCTRCYLFIKVSSVMCPCCKTQLRVKSAQCKVSEAKTTKRKFPSLRALSKTSRGYNFGAFENITAEAKLGYNFFISKEDSTKDWCECMGFIHGKMCYHIKEVRLRFEVAEQ